MKGVRTTFLTVNPKLSGESHIFTCSTAFLLRYSIRFPLEPLESRSNDAYICGFRVPVVVWWRVCRQCFYEARAERLKPRILPAGGVFFPRWLQSGICNCGWFNSIIIPPRRPRIQHICDSTPPPKVSVFAPVHHNGESIGSSHFRIDYLLACFRSMTCSPAQAWFKYLPQPARLSSTAWSVCKTVI